MFIGHKKIINLLDRSIKKNKVAQAYLFSGPESVGKFLLARYFAKALIFEKDINTILRSIVVNDELKTGVELLDMMIVEPEREEKKGIVKEKDIKIEQIREAQKSLALFPYNGKFKVLIIRHAEKMTKGSQNSLLKLLEEPNSTSIIILVASNVSRILPTIQSRCLKINFATVNDAEIEAGLKKMNLPAGPEFIKLAIGRPGIAINLGQDPDLLNDWKKISEDLEKIHALSLSQRLELAEEYAKNVVEAVKKIEIWIWLLRLKSMQNGKLEIAAYEKIAMIEAVIRELTSTNINSRLALENLFISL